MSARRRHGAAPSLVSAARPPVARALRFGWHAQPRPAMSDEPDVASVVKRLAAYLAGHPRASDTAEGIAAWWLPPPPPVTPEEVAAALSWLVDCGVLAALPAADGRVRYGCRADRPDLALRLGALARDPHALLGTDTGPGGLQMN